MRPSGLTVTLLTKSPPPPNRALPMVPPIRDRQKGNNYCPSANGDPGRAPKLTEKITFAHRALQHDEAGKAAARWAGRRVLGGSRRRRRGLCAGLLAVIGNSVVRQSQPVRDIPKEPLRPEQPDRN